MRRILTLLAIIPIFLAYSQTPCENGLADGYSCYGMDLMARVDVISLGAEEHGGVWVSDIWGWTDPETNKEYALIGMTNGTSFVDVTDPTDPIVLGVLKEHNWDVTSARTPSTNGTKGILHDGAKSVWRDVKVYGNYAYIVSEDSNHGLQVFDLTELRDVTETPVDFQESGHYDGIGQAHNIFINEDTGFLYAVGYREGRTCSNGGLHIVDLADPVNPTYAGCYDNDGYTHDTQCVIYNGPDEDYVGQEICFSSNEDTITLTDVTDKNAPAMISRTGYPEAEYVHQGWLTEDHRYFLSNDELDEIRNGVLTQTRIWDMIDLENPQLIGVYEHETRAIDHNLYVKGNRVFESNYTNGIRVLNLADVANGNLEEEFFFDTYKANDNPSFLGTWSNYPYFESGNIIVSDITNGLFILRTQSVIIETQPADYYACVDEHLSIPISVAGENLTYQWQLDEGDGFADILDFERYHSTTTDSLHAHTVVAEQSGGKYRCIITDEFDVEFISDTMTLFVGVLPAPNFTYESVKGEITFTNTSENATSFEWNFGDGESSTEENPIHTFETYDEFEVELIAYNDCSSETATQIIDRLILKAQPENVDIKIFPVPATDRINFELDLSFAGTDVVVLSLDGKSVYQSIAKNGNNSIDVSNFKRGIYLLNISSNGHQITKRFLVR